MLSGAHHLVSAIATLYTPMYVECDAMLDLEPQNAWKEGRPTMVLLGTGGEVLV